MMNRGKLEQMADLLVVLVKNPKPVSFTSVGNMAGMPSYLFKPMLEKLIDADLIKIDVPLVPIKLTNPPRKHRYLVITTKGRKFIELFENLKKLIGEKTK